MINKTEIAYYLGLVYNDEAIQLQPQPIEHLAEEFHAFAYLTDEDILVGCM